MHNEAVLRAELTALESERSGARCASTTSALRQWSTKAIRDLNLTDSVVAAVIRNHDFVVSRGTTIAEGDHVVFVGTVEAVKRARDLFLGQRALAGPTPLGFGGAVRPRCHRFTTLVR